ncbi:MAG: hypothetical protein AAGD11_20395 [Planctomycetota bacterium]
MDTLLPQILHDVSGLLLLWLASGMGLIAISGFALRRARRVPISDLQSAEDGSAYAAPLLLTLPIFVTLLTFFVECNSLMLGKIGTVYASYAATRSAVVWLPIDERADDFEERLQHRCHLAAAKALAPFASGKPEHGPSAFDAYIAEHAERFAAAFRAYSGAEPNQRNHLQQKFINAYYATDVTVETGDSADADEVQSVTVSVLYHAPFLTPGMGRVMGTEDSVRGTRVWSFGTKATLGIERPVVIGSLPAHRLTNNYALGVRHGEDR